MDLRMIEGTDLLEAAVNKLETSVLSANEKLNNIEVKIDEYQRKIIDCKCNEPRVSVLKLMKDWNEMNKMAGLLKQQGDSIMSTNDALRDTINDQLQSVQNCYIALQQKVYEGREERDGVE